jgi:hypothetical protein
MHKDEIRNLRPGDWLRTSSGRLGTVVEKRRGIVWIKWDDARIETINPQSRIDCESARYITALTARIMMMPHLE